MTSPAAHVLKLFSEEFYWPNRFRKSHDLTYFHFYFLCFKLTLLHHLIAVKKGLCEGDHRILQNFEDVKNSMQGSLSMSTQTKGMIEFTGNVSSWSKATLQLKKQLSTRFAFMKGLDCFVVAPKANIHLEVNLHWHRVIIDTNESSVRLFRDTQWVNQIQSSWRN